MKIGVLTSSIRDGRQSIEVANWVLKLAKERNEQDVEYELIDIKDFNLPMFGDNVTEADQANIAKFSEKMNAQDGFVFTVAEYNHGVTGVLKNALDFLKPEVANKVAGFVGYGGVGGARAIEQMRSITGELSLAGVQRNVNLFLSADFENFSVFKPGDFQKQPLNEMLDQMLLWGRALKTIR
ncbi:MAG TPA: NAD(P)H-dependent oxidoreductase [Acholeplasmataceae bacterium]|nr:NAD(P)H-dependent oxidoreductase [Acholeplasmataceae bacterium]